MGEPQIITIEPAAEVSSPPELEPDPEPEEEND